MKKSAIVIGASGDIGQQICASLKDSGWNCIQTFCNHPVENAFHLDLKDPSQFDPFLKDAFNNNDYVDTLIFCAGVSQKRALIFDTSDDEIDNLFQINIISAVKIIKRFVKLVKGRPANIILIGSFVEKNGCSCESVYAATKSALSGLCKSLATELGNLGIRINVVAPGFIDTKMNNNLSKEEKEDMADMTPLCRLGNCFDVANAVCFLASDNASFITGQTIFVDGGLILE